VIRLYVGGITLMLTTGDIEDAIIELSSDIERREWKKTKAAAIRLRYLEGIERAAKKWMDNIT
jgi:molecular chaperone HscB